MNETHSRDFMEILRSKVDEEYKLEKENLMRFFVQRDFDIEQSKKLSQSLNRAIFYMKMNLHDRSELEIETINHLRDKIKLEIKQLETILGQRKALEKITVDDNIFFRGLNKVLNDKIKLEKIPRAGHNIMFRLALCPFFWQMEKYGLIPARQIDLAYDLFVEYKLDHYGETLESGKSYNGEDEQKDLIRKQFQLRAVRYFDNFDKHLGWG